VITRPENITYQDIKDLIKALPTHELRAMFCLLYATGCRVSELKTIEAQNIRRITDNKGRDIVRIYSKVLKKRRAADRFIPIHIKSESFLAWPIINYAKDKEGPLFTQTRSTIWRWCLKYSSVRKINPHGLRKIRASHLVTVFGHNAYHLKKFFNWSNLNSSAPYVGLKIEDIVPEVGGK